MLLCVHLEPGPFAQRSRYVASAAADVLNGLVRANMRWLLARQAAGQPLPHPYRSGVKYQEEPWSGFEEFADIPTVVKRGWGDCDDLASWLCAYLRVVHKEKARLRITWRKTGGRRMFHVVVRRANGTVEDPSRVLGMGKT